MLTQAMENNRRMGATSNPEKRRSRTLRRSTIPRVARILKKFMRTFLVTAVALCVVGLSHAETKGQTDLRLAAGYTGFVHQDVINHAAIGGSLRYYLTPRLATSTSVTWG